MALSKAVLLATRRQPVALYREAYVKANAGITAGVTPGFTGATGLVGGGQADLTAAVSITARGQVSSIPGFVANGATGDSRDDPYLVQTNYWHVTGSVAVTINDPSAAVYWIKFRDSIWEFCNTGCLSINMAGGVIADRCRFSNGSQTQDCDVLLARGTFRSTSCLITSLNNDNFVKKTGGDDAIVEIVDPSVTHTAAFGYVNGLLRNTGTGGSISMERFTLGSNFSGPLVLLDRGTALNIQRGDINPADGANFTYIVGIESGALLENWTQGFTCRDNRVRCGTAAGVPNCVIGSTNHSAIRGVRNWTIEHNHITAIDGRLSGKRLISWGNSTTTDPDHSRNISIRFNRFRKDPAHAVAGNEIIYGMRSADVLIEGNWTDECGEDAYEVHQPILNNVIRYNGGGEEGGSGKVGGNMVDFYGAGGVWDAAAGNQGAHQLHHLWGTCGGDAWVVDSVHGVAVHHIDVDNVAGGFGANPPAANGRLHGRATSGVPSFQNVVVDLPLSDPAISFNGKPCELTYESSGVASYAATAPGTVSWPEWDGSAFEVKGGADGIVDSML